MENIEFMCTQMTLKYWETPKTKRETIHRETIQVQSQNDLAINENKTKYLAMTLHLVNKALKVLTPLSNWISLNTWDTT